jgi:hypothetical protein
MISMVVKWATMFFERLMRVTKRRLIALLVKYLLVRRLLASRGSSHGGTNGRVLFYQMIRRERAMC